ncbi:MAG: efflux transporter outer membrane subunit [Rubrivivax sp.]
MHPLLRLPTPRLTRGVAACVLAQALAACAPLPVALPPVTPVPESFREPATLPEGARAPEAMPDGGWWRVFGDPRLDAWIESARSGNPGLAQAAARVARAAAALGVEAARAQPQLDAGVGATRQVGPLVNAVGSRGNLFDARALLSWDLDLLQRLSRQQQAALHDLRAQQALQRQAARVLEADVAQTYLAWRAVVAEQGALEAVLASDRALAAVAERRVQAGLVPAHVKSVALADQWADEAELQALARRRALLEHALVALAGGQDADGFTTSGVAPDPATMTPPAIPPGLPSRMLQRRDDVAAAEQALQAARLRLGLARDAWFPSLTLTAHAGLASSELGQWLRAAARSAGLGLLLNLPLLDGGRLDAERAAAEAALQEATAAHRERVVQALREVEDQLATLRTLALEAELRRAAVDEAAREAERAQQSWTRGLVAQAEPLLAARVRDRQRRLWLQAQAARQQATVQLVRALGGGWSGAVAATDTDGTAATAALGRPHAD